jgi:hypothetical protein
MCLRAKPTARRLSLAVVAAARSIAANGIADYRQVSLEVIGTETIYGPHSRVQSCREVMGKYGLHHDNPKALAFASAEFAYLTTSAAPGLGGFGAGRVRPQPLMMVHSAVLDKSEVPITVQLGDRVIVQQCYETSEVSAPTPKVQMQIAPCDYQGDWVEVPLEKLAYARSGDKGDNANIGLIAREQRFLPILSEQVTAQAVDDYFAQLVEGEVERFEVPGLNAFNFLMTEALGGGGTGSVRVDAQGKGYGQMLLSMTVKAPAEWVQAG